MRASSFLSFMQEKVIKHRSFYLGKKKCGEIMELIKIQKGIYYIENFTNIGVVEAEDKNVILIDSGLEDRAARKIMELLKEKGYKPGAVVNTHSHADHCGGNSYLKKNTGLKVYASDYESSIIEHPYLEPFSMFSGAEPISDLQNKFLMAQPSKVDMIIGEGRLRILGRSLEIIKLPGHSINQIGIGVEGVFFSADAIFSEKVLKKYKIPFFINIEKQKETLNKLEELEFDTFVASHIKPVKNVKELCKINKSVITRIEELILSILKAEKTTEGVLNEVFKVMEITIISAQQYYLLKTSIMAYLSYLKNMGKINIKVQDNNLYWKKTT